jgi:DNA gyrase inhibitor GyrI
MTRIESVRAATVAMRSCTGKQQSVDEWLEVFMKWDRLTSGQMMVVMIEAGTTMPPIPRPAMVRIPQS